MDRYTVAEYAKAKDFTPQYVYKLIRQDKINYEEIEEDGKKQKFIFESLTADEKARLATKEGEVSQPIKPNSFSYSEEGGEEGVSQPNFATNNPEVSQPNAQGFATDETAPQDPQIALIALLRDELAEKNKQIERLQEQSRTQEENHKQEIERLHKLLDQQQQLNALSIKYLSAGAEEAPQEEEQQAEPPQEEPKKKRSFWAWLMGE